MADLQPPAARAAALACLGKGQAKNAAVTTQETQILSPPACYPAPRRDLASENHFPHQHGAQWQLLRGRAELLHHNDESPDPSQASQASLCTTVIPCP